MHIFALGASRNIGYHACLCKYDGIHRGPCRLIIIWIVALARGDTVTFLLRNPAILEEDSALKPYIQSGHAIFVQGDATSQEEVRKAWGVASNKAPVDFVLFTIGKNVSFMSQTNPNMKNRTFSGAQGGKFHPLKGFIINPPNLCTISVLNVLRAIASTDLRPRLAVVAATGVTTASHRSLPLIMKPIYSWLLPNAFADKRGMETIVHHAIGKEYDAHQTPGPNILPEGWKNDLPSAGWLKSSVIIRPAMLTDGAMTKKYRAVLGDNFTSYTISRSDVGHFIIEGLLPEWSKYEGNVVAIGY
jgi:hypothetical protein